MVFPFKVQVIKVGSGLGIVIPKEILKSKGVEPGDIIDVEITHVNTWERSKYQSKRRYKKDFAGNWVKEK